MNVYMSQSSNQVSKNEEYRRGFPGLTHVKKKKVKLKKYLFLCILAMED
jgi:hypothetical protein